MNPGKEISLFNIFPNFVKTIPKYINNFKPKLEKDTKCALLLRELNTPIEQGNYLTLHFFINYIFFGFLIYKLQL